MPPAPENAQLYSSAYPRLVIVGRTGAGKSSSGNKVAGRELFEAADSYDSVTTSCHAFKVSIGGRDTVLMDSPGFGDSAQRDTEHTAKLVEECKKFGVIHWWMLVVKESDRRLDGPARAMLDMLTKSYGNDFLDHVILCVTHWEYGDRAEQRRVRKHQTARHLHDNWAAVCRQRYGRSAQFTMPMVLLDNELDEQEEEEVQGFHQQLAALGGFVANAPPPYQTAAAVAAKTDLDEQKDRVDELSQAFELDVKYGADGRIVTRDMGVTGATRVEVLKSRVSGLFGFNISGNWWLGFNTTGAVKALTDGYTLSHYGITDGSRILVVGNANGGPGMLSGHKAAMRNSPTKTMMGVGGIPTHRMCPRCWLFIQHMGGGCKAVTCPKCHVGFCMSCLGVIGSDGQLPCGGHGSVCTVAPRQDVTA